jgi:hypothetical protein
MPLPLMGILAGASAIGKIAGGLGKGRAEGRKTEADVNLQRDQLASSQYGTQQRSLLDAANAMAGQNVTDAQMGLQAPSMRAKQALLGDALKNFQYKAPTHARANVVDFGSPYNLSDSTRELGGLLSTGALADQRQGNSPLEKVDFMSNILKPPTQTSLPQSGWLDKVLNTASAIGSFAGAGKDLMGGDEPTKAKSIADMVPIESGVPNFGMPTMLGAPVGRVGKIPNVRF